MFSFFEKKKIWNNWYRAEKTDVKSIQSFLSPHENSCISITSRLMHGGNINPDLVTRHEVYLEKTGGKIVSLMMCSTDSVIVPVFTSESATAAPEAILKQSSINRKKYLTLMGLKKDIIMLEELFAGRNRLSVDYFQLAAVSADVPDIINEYLAKKPSIDKCELSINKASPSDLEKLMPLRKAYEIEEVLINNSHFSDAACRNRLKKTIMEQSVFYAALDGIPAATCCINSGGLGWYQIGGVYTKPEFRSKGISARIMAELANESMRSGKNLTLFVKKDNASALKLYSNCGFKKTGEFRITYAERR